MINVTGREVKALAYWKEHDINNKARAKNKGRKKFYFLDGPPYVTGDLHPGQMWVKTIKDIFLRYKRFRGFDVRDRAGYDVHGLPIENKVEQILGVNSKKEIESKIGVENFVKKCREYVDSFKGRMENDFYRFGISLDFSDPYLPYKNEYMNTEWGIFKKIDDKGLLYRGKKTTAFCTRCGTALAQGSMEVTYEDTDDPSIYVTFKAVKKSPKSKIEVDDNTYLLVWTTTPWTIPANVAVAVHPEELYVLVETGGRSMIVAKQRLDTVVSAIDQSATVKAEFYGSELAGLKYLSPLEDKVPMQKEMRKHHKVILSESLVTMGEGTGLVHIAPGHGLEDYLIGVKNRLPIFSPVGPSGLYTGEAGAYNGIQVPGDANLKVMEDLSEKGAMFGKGSIRHSYPHCWRCDTKLIYIATDQWFFNIQKIKKRLISENSKVVWHPSEASGWQEDVLKSSPDWCVSRQRYWGTPMPIWQCGKCASTVTIGSIKELREHAINKEKVDALKDIHMPYIDAIILKCGGCGAEMKRVSDMIDVWFDAASSFRASMTEEEFSRWFPIDYIIEGKDQLRAWFSALLKVSVMVYGKKPYKNIGIDGMLLDEKGREMHKKLGNYVGLDEIYNSVGADTFRLWCTDHTPWLDLNWNRSELKDAGKAVLVLYNISNLLSEYQSSLGYKPKFRSRMSTSGLDVEEVWILSRLESTILEVTAALDDYRAFDAAELIKRFVTEDFSRFYLKLAKKSILYGSKKKARQVINAINYVLYKLLVIISPITPFVADGVYLERYANKESIFLEDWPKPNAKSISSDIDNKMDIARDAITAILNSREKAGVPLRWPISKVTLEVTDTAAYTALQELSGIVESHTNAKKLEMKQVSGARKEVKPLFAKLGPAFKGNAAEVADLLKSVNADELLKSIESTGNYGLHTNNGVVNITADHFTVVERAEVGDRAAFKFGTAYIDKEMSNELKDEALLREFERNVQMIRKELKLSRIDSIELNYDTVGELARIIPKDMKQLKKGLKASHIGTKVDSSALVKELDIEGEMVKVSVKKA